MADASDNAVRESGTVQPVHERRRARAASRQGHANARREPLPTHCAGCGDQRRDGQPGFRYFVRGALAVCDGCRAKYGRGPLPRMMLGASLRDPKLAAPPHTAHV